MKGYKGFTKDLKCLDKQYTIGKTYTEDKVKLCESGMHFCENPIDCLEYYDPVYHSRYCKIEADDVADVGNDIIDSKRVCGKMKVKKEITIDDIIKDSFSFIKNKSTDKKSNYNQAIKFMALDQGSKRKLEPSILSENDFYLALRESHSLASFIGKDIKVVSLGECCQISSAGDDDLLISSGALTQLSISGDDSSMVSSGDSHKLASSGLCTNITSYGRFAQVASSGNRNKMLSYGDESFIASSGEGNRVEVNASRNSVAVSGNRTTVSAEGNCNKVVCSGSNSAVEVIGEHNICCALGILSACRGTLGSFIGLTEWKRVDGEMVPVDAKFFKVDGKTIKPNVFYRLVNGKPDEVMRFNMEYLAEENE